MFSNDTVSKQSINYSSTANIPTDEIGFSIEEMLMTARNRRRLFERRWYD